MESMEYSEMVGVTICGKTSRSINAAGSGEWQWRNAGNVASK
jgi:hypothetical protein